LLPHIVYGRHPERPEIVCTKIESIKGSGAAIGVSGS
jgi:hypothetical protein